MSEEQEVGIPDWIVTLATEHTTLPFHHALEVEYENAVDFYGWPLPNEDPREKVERERRGRVRGRQRVLSPGRFYGEHNE